MFDFLLYLVVITFSGLGIGLLLGAAFDDFSLVPIGIVISFSLFMFYKFCKLCDDVQSIRNKYLSEKKEEKTEN